MSEEENISFKEIQSFLKKNPDLYNVLKDSKKRGALAFFFREDSDRIDYLMKNPWIDLEKIVKTADGIMNISPDIQDEDLLNILCRDAAVLTNAKSATCRTYDPIKNTMVAGGAFNWDVERAEEISYEDSISGHVMRTKNHYCVPDVNSETMYKEKEKILSMGLNSVLALPLQLLDYEGAEKKEVLIGALQLYFEEKDKYFYEAQIKLLKSIVSRFSFVLVQKKKRDLQKGSKIIQESRKALVSVFKHTQSLDQALSFLVTKIAEIINVNRCSLFSIEKDSSGQRFAVLIAGYPLSPFAHKYGETLSFDEHSAFREVCDSGVPLLIEDAKKDARMKASYKLYLQKKIENVYFIPIKDGDNVVNVLVLDGDESKPIEKDVMFFCNALIQDIELCIRTSIRSNERHDFYNQILSFSAIANVYTKMLAKPETTREELDLLYKKLCKSMYAVDDIVTDGVPFAQKVLFDLNEVIQERVDACHLPSGVTFRKNLNDKSLQILADRKKVGRIVGNLLDNACKKLEEFESGELVVVSRFAEGYAVIEVGNTGNISQELQEKIMHDNNPIQKHDREDKSMGLSIVKIFTVMHNGVMEFESLPENNWTVFRIKLPVV